MRPTKRKQTLEYFEAFENEKKEEKPMIVLVIGSVDARKPKGHYENGKVEEMEENGNNWHERASRDKNMQHKDAQNNSVSNASVFFSYFLKRCLNEYLF